MRYSMLSENSESQQLNDLIFTLPLRFAKYTRKNPGKSAHTIPSIFPVTYSDQPTDVT